jgi:hypothetical protein
MVARLSKKREIKQEMSPEVGFRFLANAPPQEALKLPGWSQSLTYEPMSAASSFWVPRNSKECPDTQIGVAGALVVQIARQRESRRAASVRTPQHQ